MLLNVVDVEATCWEGDPPAGQRNEIIEIGFVTQCSADDVLLLVEDGGWPVLPALS